jgi:hypothetical protein
VETTPELPAASDVPSAQPRGSRMQLFGADDPDYAAIAGDNVDRSLPDAAERLLVMRDGAVVADLGILTVPEEEQAKAPLQERVALAEDASAAVVVRVERKASAPEQASVTWIPAEDPQQAWRKALEPGHRVTLALPIPKGRGLVLVSEVPDAPDTLRVYDAKGTLGTRLAGTPARVVELRASESGRFVGADLAYLPRAGSPDRAVWVHDVASRTAWTHTWKYGGDDEVTTWRLLEDGTLEADTAEFRFVLGPGDRVIDRKRRQL